LRAVQVRARQPKNEELRWVWNKVASTIIDFRQESIIISYHGVIWASECLTARLTSLEEQ
jgi:hypothetical protein